MTLRTVGQHQLSTIVLPVDGAPRTAANVRVVGETVRTPYNLHDSDIAIHIQSGDTVADRPAAGNKYALFVANDTGLIYVDDGSAWDALGYAPLAHAHSAADVTSGILAVARGGTAVGAYTKGDILIASAAAVLTALAVGANNKVLTADSAQATGVKWGDAALLATIGATATIPYFSSATTLDDSSVTYDAANTALKNATQPSETDANSTHTATVGVSQFGSYIVPVAGVYLVTVIVHGSTLGASSYIEIDVAAGGDIGDLVSPTRFDARPSGGGNAVCITLMANCTVAGVSQIRAFVNNGTAGTLLIGVMMKCRLLV